MHKRGGGGGREKEREIKMENKACFEKLVFTLFKSEWSSTNPLVSNVLVGIQLL